MSDEQKLTDRQSTVVHLLYRMSPRRDVKQGRAYTIKAETKRFVSRPVRSLVSLLTLREALVPATWTSRATTAARCSSLFLPQCFHPTHAHATFDPGGVYLPDCRRSSPLSPYLAADADDCTARAVARLCHGTTTLPATEHGMQ